MAYTFRDNEIRCMVYKEGVPNLHHRNKYDRRRDMAAWEFVRQARWGPWELHLFFSFFFLPVFFWGFPGPPR